MDAVTIRAATFTRENGLPWLTMETDAGELRFDLAFVNRLLVRDGWAPLADPVPQQFQDRTINPKPNTVLSADATDAANVVALLWHVLRANDRGEVQPGPVAV